MTYSSILRKSSIIVEENFSSSAKIFYDENEWWTIIDDLKENLSQEEKFVHFHFHFHFNLLKMSMKKKINLHRNVKFDHFVHHNLMEDQKKSFLIQRQIEINLFIIVVNNSLDKHWLSNENLFLWFLVWLILFSLSFESLSDQIVFSLSNSYLCEKYSTVDLCHLIFLSTNFSLISIIFFSSSMFNNDKRKSINSIEKPQKSFCWRYLTNEQVFNNTNEKRNNFDTIFITMLKFDPCE